MRPKKNTSSTINMLKGNGCSWVNVCATTKLEMSELHSRFDFYEEDLEAALPPIQRPHIIEREHYLFVIMLFPMYDRSTGIMHRTEVDFFIGQNYIVTIHQNTLESLKVFFEFCVTQHDSQKLLSSPGAVLDSILNEIMFGISDMLVHMGNDIDVLHDRIFESKHEENVISELLRIKTNVSTFRSAVQSHKRILDKLLSYEILQNSSRLIAESMRELQEESKENWDTIQNYHDNVNALNEAFVSKVGVRTNHIMKFLTMISAVMLPLSLVTTIFAMDVGGLPMQGENGFMILAGVMIIMTLLSLWFYKAKQWL